MFNPQTHDIIKELALGLANKEFDAGLRSSERLLNILKESWSPNCVGILNSSDLAQLFRQSSPIRYKQDDIIVNEGQPTDGLYVIVSGSAALSFEKQNELGFPMSLMSRFIEAHMANNKASVDLLTEGDVFGESSLFGAPVIPYTAKALTDLLLIKIEKTSVELLYSQKPLLRQCLLDLYTSILNRMTEEVRVASAKRVGRLSDILAGITQQPEDAELAKMDSLVSSEPANPFSHINKARMLLKRGGKAEAVAGFLKGASILKGLNAMSKALAFYKVVARIEPDNVAVQESIEELMAMHPRHRGLVNKARDLDNSLFLSLLDPSGIQSLFEKAGQRQLQAGEVVIEEGRQADATYIVKKGAALVDIAGLGSIPLTTGDMFGELSIFTGEPITASVRADGALEVYVISKPMITDLLNTIPEIIFTLDNVYQTRTKQILQALKRDY
ncbi:MAG: cyclic nucleotide-binding domain-containing protein [Nitrospirae bacterium]|nr:cyclic nucleotide-binding domain-containing protein [Nitrospirota bacterium]